MQGTSRRRNTLWPCVGTSLRTRQGKGSREEEKTEQHPLLLSPAPANPLQAPASTASQAAPTDSQLPCQRTPPGVDKATQKKQRRFCTTNLHPTRPPAKLSPVGPGDQGAAARGTELGCVACHWLRLTCAGGGSFPPAAPHLARDRNEQLTKKNHFGPCRSLPVPWPGPLSLLPLVLQKRWRPGWTCQGSGGPGCECQCPGGLARVGTGCEVPGLGGLGGEGPAMSTTEAQTPAPAAAESSTTSTSTTSTTSNPPSSSGQPWKTWAWGKRQGNPRPSPRLSGFLGSLLVVLLVSSLAPGVLALAALELASSTRARLSRLPSTLFRFARSGVQRTSSSATVGRLPAHRRRHDSFHLDSRFRPQTSSRKNPLSHGRHRRRYPH